jgi:hypothetical protein
MQFRIGIVALSIIAAGAGVSGCASGAGAGRDKTLMETCTENAKTQAERSECAWQNASRMASGR